VAHGMKQDAGIKGDIAHASALSFFGGLLDVLRDSGFKGLVLVLDEVETIQRVKSDSREKSLNALRQLIDDVHGGRYPGLYVIITGTPPFFDGRQGIKRSEPLAQRLHTEFDANPEFDSSRAPQIRLTPFTHERLVEVGRRVRELYPSDATERIEARVTDAVIDGLARSVAGKLGGKVGIAPRIFLKRLLDLLDRVDEHPTFDPTVHYQLVIESAELRPEEAAAAGVTRSVEDIELDLTTSDDEELG